MPTEILNQPSSSASADSVDDIVLRLNDGDSSETETDESQSESEPVKEPAVEEETETDESETEGTDEADEKIELKDEDEEKTELTDLPNRQKILKEYPELFKKFPGLERAMYREQKYTEVFPSIDEARTAKDNLENFRQVETDLMSGNISGVLTAVKSNNPKAFGKIANGLLDTLAQVDQTAYLGTINGVLKQALKAVADSGKSAGTEDGSQLEIAAKLINKFLYNSYDIQAPDKPVKAEEENPRETELTRREQEFNKRQFDMALGDVSTRTSSIIKSAVEQNIDKRNIMTPYVKSKAVKDVQEKLEQLIASDSRFKAVLDNLWRDSWKNGYSDDSRKKIKQAIISKAQTLLPDVIRQVKGDALKGSATVRGKKQDVVEEKPQSNTRRQATPNNSQRTPEKPRRLNSVDRIVDFLGR